MIYFCSTSGIRSAMLRGSLCDLFVRSCHLQTKYTVCLVHSLQRGRIRVALLSHCNQITLDTVWRQTEATSLRQSLINNSVCI